MGISPTLRDFQGAVERVGKLFSLFPAFHRPAISIALRHPSSSSVISRTHVRRWTEVWCCWREGQGPDRDSGRVPSATVSNPATAVDLLKADTDGLPLSSPPGLACRRRPFPLIWSRCVSALAGSPIAGRSFISASAATAGSATAPQGVAMRRASCDTGPQSLNISALPRDAAVTPATNGPSASASAPAPKIK